MHNKVIRAVYLQEAVMTQTHTKFYLKQTKLLQIILNIEYELIESYFCKIVVLQTISRRGTFISEKRRHKLW